MVGTQGSQSLTLGLTLIAAPQLGESHVIEPSPEGEGSTPVYSLRLLTFAFAAALTLTLVAGLRCW